jgi:S-(hydroxymethyl)glutathione dehydrogenase/alcohol dehydrogenase
MVLGHEGAGIVESVGEGVTELKAGDHVIPIFLPQCRECKVCKHPTANFCLKFIDQGNGLMPDGTSRMHCKGKDLHRFLGVSSFSEYSVLPAYNVAKVDPKAPLEKVCLLSCGVATGYGAAVNTAKVTPGSTCAIWGLGGIGYAAILGCRNAGAKRIIGIDVVPEKYEFAKLFGCNEFVNPRDLDKPLVEHLKDITGGLGVDFTLECVGSIPTMTQALESAAIGFGTCVLVGVSPAGKKMEVLPWDMQMGRTLRGTFFGCYKSVDGIPKLVGEYMDGKIDEILHLITHQMKLEDINKAFELMKAGKSIRSIITYD